MLYLQIKEEYDNADIVRGDMGVTYNIGFVVGGELYTIREATEKGIPIKMFREISTPKSNTFKTFGVRKVIDESKVTIINEKRI